MNEIENVTIYLVYDFKNYFRRCLKGIEKISMIYYFEKYQEFSKKNQ